MIKKIAEKKIELAFLLLIFALSFAAYYLTAPREIFFGDNAEFITAVKALGVPHPSGYPLYLILAKIFSFLIPGSLPLKINLFSSLFSSLSLVLLFLIGKKIALAGDENSRKKIPVYLILMSGIMLLAFSRIFWYQAIVAKTYPLNLFLSLGLLYLLILYLEKRSGRLFYIITFISGLAVSNHQMILLFIPFVLAGLIYPLKNFNWKKALAGAGLFFLGLSAYLYLPLLSRLNPPLDWGRTGKSVGNFICHVSRRSYNDYLNGSTFFDINLFLLSFGADAFKELGPYIAFCLLGFWRIFRKRRKYAYFLTALLASSSLFLILLRSSIFTEENRQFYSAYYLPAYSLIALVSSLGLVYLWDYGEKIFGKKIIAAFFLAVIFLPAGYSFYRNCRINNFSGFRFLNGYSAGIIESLEPDAVLAVSFEGPDEDSLIFSLLYQREVNKIRPDVSFIGYIDIFKQADPKKVNDIFLLDEEIKRDALAAYAWENFGAKRPVYATFLSSSENLTAVSNGLAYRLFGKNQEQEPEEEYFSLAISDKDKNIMENDFFGREILANYYMSQAAAYLNKKNPAAAEGYFIRSLRLNYFPIDIDRLNFLKLKNATDNK